ncbi:MAG: hypothetical protein WBG18_27585 [Xanthobacteraceae bacterium]
MPERRFPPPWSIEDLGPCFVVKDSAGQKLSYVYFLACQQKFSPNERTHPMNDGNEDLNQTDEEILRDEVSDEAVESAFVALGGLPTLMHGSYCFTCRPAIGS